MTSVWQSKSVVVRLSDSDQLQLEVTNAVEQGTISSSNHLIKKKMYLDVYNHSYSCVYPSTKCNIGHTTEWLESKIIWQLRWFVFKFTAY